MRKAAKGGPDGITTRLLNFLNENFPNLILGATKQLIDDKYDKPHKIALIHLIFINKKTTKKDYKKFRAINLISSLINLSARVMTTRMDTALLNSDLIPDYIFAYLKGRSAQDLNRSLADIVQDVCQRSKIIAVLQSDF